ncbi:MAG: Rv3654c family TadE-like protein [Pseudonocardiaceae bacterium]
MSVVLAVCGVAVVLLGCVVAVAGSALIASTRADSAADLAALAAASRASAGQVTACRLAQWIAEANRARVDHCRLDGLDAVVTVHGRSIDGMPPDWIRSTSRAGPAWG